MHLPIDAFEQTHSLSISHGDLVIHEGNIALGVTIDDKFEKTDYLLFLNGPNAFDLFEIEERYMVCRLSKNYSCSIIVEGLPIPFDKTSAKRGSVVYAGGAPGIAQIAGPNIQIYTLQGRSAAPPRDELGVEFHNWQLWMTDKSGKLIGDPLVSVSI
ncbi:hypothetical protein U2S91_09400 [Stenotrophomonas maltophilia]|nr:hypothetical protein [Stenotrophomonas maltophilia]WQI22824.1 hypothetical protein U2S91_09400 [Stenotrophomonas maltophilia]